jgi:hypothetical protein
MRKQIPKYSLTREMISLNSAHVRTDVRKVITREQIGINTTHVN